jgi:hypothetical protein
VTLGDTAFVLQEGLTVSGKPPKDHHEVIGHARAIDLVYAVVDQHRRVTVDDLHGLHRAVQTELVVDAFNPTGRWKVEPNGTTALLTSGSTQWHDFAKPEHVQALMDAWLELLERARRPGSGNLLDRYTDLHARLLANIPVIEGGERARQAARSQGLASSISPIRAAPR